MPFVELEVALAHCKADSEDSEMVKIYLAAAEKMVVDFLDRNVYVDQDALQAANDETGIVINPSIIAAILLNLGFLYMHREVTDKMPAASENLLRPDRRVGT